jgi:DinB superfamily
MSNMPKTLAALLVALLVPAVTGADPMKKEERQRLLAHLEMTEAWLQSEVQGLSDAQLRFRMTPQSWTIIDVVEHLAIAEPQYWQRVHDSMKQPPNTEKLEATDAGILWYGIDRTVRTTTGEARVPTGKVPGLADPLNRFVKLRAAMKEYAKTTDADLRSRKLLEGNMDVYQWFLMISTHSQRHILQIREIRADPGYPK